MPSAAISVSVEATIPIERVDLCVRAFGMTTREADVVRRVARGLDTACIASELNLARYTIQDHMKSIFTKTGVDSRRDRALISVRRCVSSVWGWAPGRVMRRAKGPGPPLRPQGRCASPAAIGPAADP